MAHIDLNFLILWNDGGLRGIMADYISQRARPESYFEQTAALCTLDHS